jgi:glycyl-tRNA synthetase alpha subunit
MLQHIRSIIQVTWRRCDNVSGTSCKLLAEDLTTYQERLASHLKKMLQRIRNIWQVTWRRVYNVSGTSCKLLTEDVATYQERLASYWQKILQRIRNVLQVSWRRCSNVAGNRYWQRRPQDAITPPKKKKRAKVTTLPPLHGRRHLKHLIAVPTRKKM